MSEDSIDRREREIKINPRKKMCQICIRLKGGRRIFQYLQVEARRWSNPRAGLREMPTDHDIMQKNRFQGQRFAI